MSARKSCGECHWLCKLYEDPILFPFVGIEPLVYVVIERLNNFPRARIIYKFKSRIQDDASTWSRQLKSMDAQTRLFQSADALGSFIRPNCKPNAVGEHTKMVLEALGQPTAADDPYTDSSDDNHENPNKRLKHGWGIFCCISVSYFVFSYLC